MEPGFYLTTLVFAVAALHLIFQGVDSYRRNFKISRSTKNKTATKPGDWYMFFRCSTFRREPREKIVRSRKNEDISQKEQRSKPKDSRQSLRSNLPR